MTRRQKAILKRNIFLCVIALILVVAIGLVVYIITALNSDDDGNVSQNSETSSETSSVQSTVSESSQVEYSSKSSVTQSSSSKKATSKTSDKVTSAKSSTLDADYKNLTVVNGWNPLPDDYDYEADLVEIPQKYLKGSLNQINKNVWVYLKAMLDDARKDGVDIGVWSPYRSYNTQKWLFEKQVKKQINNGVPESQAEDKAATIVTRPGTSEHNTGLALDINCANDSFENTKAFEWLKENAEDYGFVMRYSKEKQSLTGVIHESWHWRFVGIKVAKEMNELGMCLEEYVEYKK